VFKIKVEETAMLCYHFFVINIWCPLCVCVYLKLQIVLPVVLCCVSFVMNALGGAFAEDTGVQVESGLWNVVAA
jgi:hypothetical protein